MQTVCRTGLDCLSERSTVLPSAHHIRDSEYELYVLARELRCVLINYVHQFKLLIPIVITIIIVIIINVMIIIMVLVIVDAFYERGKPNETIDSH